MDVDEADLERRATIARQLKAARWMAGSTAPHDKGRVKRKVVALSAEQLAGHQALRENGVTAARIGSIERMEHYTPPMELEVIATGLGMPIDYFQSRRDEVSPEDLQRAASLLAPLLLAAARARRPAQGPGQQEMDEQDRPSEAGEGGAG